MGKKKTLTLLILNAIVALSTLVIFVYRLFFYHGNGLLDVGGIIFLRYFTNISGLLTGIVAFIVSIFLIKNLVKNTEIPGYLTTLHLIASTAEAITFFTVLCFLGPFTTNGNFLLMYKSFAFHFHFLNCVISIISFIVLPSKKNVDLKITLIGASLAVLYSFYYIPMALIDVKNDFYSFTFGGKYYLVPFVIVIMYGLSFLTSFLLGKIHNKLSK